MSTDFTKHIETAKNYLLNIDFILLKDEILTFGYDIITAWWLLPGFLLLMWVGMIVCGIKTMISNGLKEIKYTFSHVGIEKELNERFPANYDPYRLWDEQARFIRTRDKRLKHLTPEQRKIAAKNEENLVNAAVGLLG